MTDRISEAELKSTFGRRMREARRSKNFTQEMLAAEINMSVDMVGRMERGTAQPSFETLARLVNVLAVSPAFLFGGGDEETIASQSTETTLLLDRIRVLSDDDKSRVSAAIDLIVR